MISRRSNRHAHPQTHALAAAAALLAAHTAGAQVVINEVWENVPGDADAFDAFLEFIELYGEPGTDLTGFAIALIKGGTDIDANNLPEARPEIDEAFSLDGLTIGPSGVLVLANDTDGFSALEGVVPPGATLAFFTAQHIPSADTAGRLANDGSSTYLLVRQRPLHAILGGVSVFEPNYAFRKDLNPDVDFNSRLDFGTESPTTGSPAASVLEPLQIIDDVAWSNRGGKEYARDEDQEISDTPGFNPDGVSRVNYFFANPMLGLRINGSGETVPTRSADEEWIYGEQGPADGSASYQPALSGAPTDPAGDGFQDLDITGFAITPGFVNDSGPFTQFRFVRGDFNFDRTVDAADGSAIAAEVGQGLDRTTPCLGDNGFPTGQDCWFYEGRAANALMAMMNMDKADAIGGNADIVTQADLDAWLAEFGGPGPCNLADLAAELGVLNVNDIIDFVNAFNAGLPLADVSPAGGDGLLNVNDIIDFVNAFNAGCP